MLPTAMSDAFVMIKVGTDSLGWLSRVGFDICIYIYMDVHVP